MPYVLCALGKNEIYTCVRKTEPADHQLDNEPIVYCYFYEDYRRCVLEKLEIQYAFRHLCFPKESNKSNLQYFLPSTTYEDVMNVFNNDLVMILRFNPTYIQTRESTAGYKRLLSYQPTRTDDFISDGENTVEDFEEVCCKLVFKGASIDELVERLNGMNFNDLL